MPGFTPDNFVDGPAGNTPITAAKLNNIEQEEVALDPLIPSGTAASLLGQVVGYDSTATPRPVRWFTKEEHVARALGWYIVTDTRWSGGADPTGSTDSTAAITAAQTAAGSNGGTVWFPAGTYNVTTFTLASNVTLAGGGRMFPYSSPTVTIKGTGGAGSIVIDTPSASTVTSAAISGIQVNGGNTASVGINFRSANYCRVENVQVNGFTDQGIIHASGVGLVMDNVQGVNCLQTTNRASVSGVFELRSSTDAFISKCEVSGSQSGITTTGNSFAWLVSGNANFFSQCIGEVADGGWYVNGLFNSFTGCRGDLNFGHGWRFEGPGGTKGKNLLSACYALNNGRATANTYSAFHVATAANSFTGCRSVINGSGGSHKYGFEDATAYADPTYRNTFSACDGDYTTALFSADALKAPSVQIPGGPFVATGLTTVDVSHTSVISFQDTSANTVTNFTGGITGQQITLLGTNSNTTIANNATIKTSTGANKVLVANSAYVFTLWNGVWQEIAAPPVVPSAQVFTSSGTYTPPAGATLLRVDVVGAGGGGGGGGSALTSGGITNQPGGGGGAAAAPISQVVSATVLTITLGLGGTAGTGGAANSNAGGAGGNGGNTTVTGTGVSITAHGGRGGAGSGANSATTVGGGLYGASSTTTAQGIGNGGFASSGTGAAGGDPGGSNSGGGGSGGAPASGTAGGNGGNAGTSGGGGAGANGQGGTTAGGLGASATQPGAGAGGGGGGAPGGAGGSGGVGGGGQVIVTVIG